MLVLRSAKGKMVAVAFCSLFALSLTCPGAGSAEQLQIQGYKTVKKGWGNDVGSYLEELWSYIVHGHGRRSKKAVWVVVPADFDSSGSDTQNGTSEGGYQSQSGDPGLDDYLKMNDDVITPGDSGQEPSSAPAPEPATFVGLAAGLLALTLTSRKRRGKLSSS